MKIKLIKFKDIEIPERKHYNDTGADIYLPEDVEIKPFETKVIPLGFGIDLPDGYNAHMQARTSIAKRGVMVHQCAIDAGYKGEVHAIVTNISGKAHQFYKNDRLCYLVITPTVYANYTTNLGDERGSGAFGSTGK